MAAPVIKAILFLSAISTVNAYWLMGINNVITTERLDPIVNPGGVANHAHSVLGGSNFGANVTTQTLRESECTSIPIPQDKSAYWYPHLYFQWANGSFSSLTGGAVITFLDYLFDNKPGKTTAFPDNFRMLSGDPTTRSYDPDSHEQSAVTFLCLDFNGVTTRHHSLPNKLCPSGIRAQINFQSCWDGKNVDSPDHKSHVAYRSGGADKGSCKDPQFPVEIPRIFIEVYWSSNKFDSVRSQAMNTTQPFVYSYGDRTGYGYHADYFNGWDKGVLQKAVDGCNCNIYGDPTCCVQKGIFDMKKGKKCYITKSLDEATTGTLPKLPGNNPVQEEGPRAKLFKSPVTPAIIKPVYFYTDKPTATGSVVIPAVTNPGAPESSAASTTGIPSPSITTTSSNKSATTDLGEPSSTVTSKVSSTAKNQISKPTSAAKSSSTPDSPGKVAGISVGGLETTQDDAKQLHRRLFRKRMHN